jgi:hypothetical protein
MRRDYGIKPAHATFRKGSFTMKRLLLVSLLLSVSAAHASVELLNSKFLKLNVPQQKILNTLKDRFDVNQFRAVKGQVIYNAEGTPDHVLVYLFSKRFHKVEFASLPLDQNYNALATLQNYRLNQTDFAQQPTVHKDEVKCPDPSVEFIAFAPNDDQLEHDITADVAKAARAANLKTVELYTTDATRQNYLNYMSCPKLIGNFYDGDANPQLITTSDGTVTADDFTNNLSGKWKLHVTNVWLACEAYNNPMLGTIQDAVGAKKYAAGINDLEIGPSDRAGACAMKAFIAGKAMTQSFQDCYKKEDTSADQWGFGGKGTDTFLN